jgi:hypothetical protein
MEKRHALTEHQTLVAREIPRSGVKFILFIVLLLHGFLSDFFYQLLFKGYAELMQLVFFYLRNLMPE